MINFLNSVAFRRPVAKRYYILRINRPSMFQKAAKGGKGIREEIQASLNSLSRPG